MGWIVRTCVSALVGVGVLMIAGVALAQPPILVADSDTIEFKSDDGKLTSSLVVTNPSAEPIAVEVTGIGDVLECEFKVEPSRIAAQRSVTLKISSEECSQFVDGAKFEFKFGAHVVVLSGQPAAKPKSLNIGWIVTWFGVGFAGAMISAAAMVVKIRKKTSSKRIGRPEGTPIANTPGEAQDGTPKYPALGAEIPGLKADWSFSDSWATSLSAFATIFVALVGATDVLKAVLGSEPEQAVGRILVAGALAGFLTGAAPLVLRVVGKTSKPTTVGLLIGAVFTMTGVVGQILTIGWAVSKSGIDEPWGTVIFGFSFAGAALLLVYGHRTLLFLLNDACQPSPEENPDPAFYVAAALLAGSIDSTSPEQIAQIAALLAEAVPPDSSPRRYPRGNSPGDDYPRSALL